MYKGIVDLVNDKAKYSALFDLGLIAVFGIVAYFIEGEQFDKYKALFYLALLLVFTDVFAFSGFDIAAQFGRYLKNLRIGP